MAIVTKEDIERIHALYEQEKDFVKKNFLDSIKSIIVSLNDVQMQINSMRALGLPEPTNLSFVLSGNSPLSNIVNHVDGNTSTSIWFLVEYLKNGADMSFMDKKDVSE